MIWATPKLLKHHFGRLPDVSALCHFGLQTFRHFAISALRRFGPSPVSSALINKSQIFLVVQSIFDILWCLNLFSVTVAHSLLKRKVRVWIGLIVTYCVLGGGGGFVRKIKWNAKSWNKLQVRSVKRRTRELSTVGKEEVPWSALQIF